LDEIAAGRRFADGTPYLLRWRRKDGTLIWTEQRIHVERDASGALVAFRGVVRDATRRVADEHQLREALAEQARLVEELRATLDRADPGTTFLPICSYCKSVRDDDGQWLRIEAFLEETMQAELTHGICTECYREHFPHDPVD
ncbi:MAG: hypothetical protein KC619_01005, partial [Myxococcales bacterium]|nr:hypothetical protein [Myxococcales bacterium]